MNDLLAANVEPTDVRPLVVRVRPTDLQRSARIVVSGSGRIRLRRGLGLFADLTLSAPSRTLYEVLFDPGMISLAAQIDSGRLVVEGQANAHLETIFFVADSIAAVAHQAAASTLSTVTSGGEDA